MKIINLPAADREFARAVTHYHKERPSLAAEFVQELDRVSALIVENPYLGAPKGGGVRARVLDHFPFLHHLLRGLTRLHCRCSDFAPEPAAGILAEAAQVEA